MSHEPPIVQVMILKVYRSEHIHFKAGEIVSIEEGLAEQFILSDYAEYVDDEFDLAIGRITAANPQAIANLNAYVDAEIAAGRCTPMETLCAEERGRQKRRSRP